MIRPTNKLKVHAMAGKGYKIIELVGSSPDGWEEAVKKVVDTASCRADKHEDSRGHGAGHEAGRRKDSRVQGQGQVVLQGGKGA